MSAILAVRHPHPVHYYAPHAATGGTPAALIIIIVLAMIVSVLLWRRTP